MTKQCEESLETDAFHRFQKMVEIAPSTIQDRDIVTQVIQSAVQIARAVSRANADLLAIC